MTLEEFETYAKEHDLVIITRQQFEKIEHENEALKNMCHVWSNWLICQRCDMTCEHKGGN